MIILPFYMLCFCQYRCNNKSDHDFTDRKGRNRRILFEPSNVGESCERFITRAIPNTILETPTFLVQSWVLDIRDKFHANKICNSTFFPYFNFSLFSLNVNSFYFGVCIIIVRTPYWPSLSWEWIPRSYPFHENVRKYFNSFKCE